MAVSMYTRFVNVRNAMNINNFGAIGSILNIMQHPGVIFKSYGTDTVIEDSDIISTDSEKVNDKKISKAMKAYMERSRTYKTFMEQQIAEYNIGKRQLAHMMGKDPAAFSQKDVKVAIRYLFPSGLYDKEARPMMEDPNKLYQSRKEAEFDESGRPHHFLFYTTKPNYYEALHNIADKLKYLNKLEDRRNKLSVNPINITMNTNSSVWVSKTDLENLFLEKLSDLQYEYLKSSVQRLIDHPLSVYEENFINTYRKVIKYSTDNKIVETVEHDVNDKSHVIVTGCRRKSTNGTVKVIGNGSGKITINGENIRYFEDFQCREQVSLKKIV